MAGRPRRRNAGRYATDQLGGEPWLSTDPQFFVAHAERMAYALACCLLPIFAVLMFAGIAVHVLQGGFLFLPEKLAPDLTRLDPLQGFARIFSLTNLVRLLMGLLKMAVVAGVAYASLYGQGEKILGLAAMTTPAIAAFLAQVLIWTGMKIALALLLLAVLDYGFQWWKHQRDLRMTPQEVREELRNFEANPQMALRRKQVQRELALHGIASAVPKAHAVIASATESAVAIRYDPRTMAAPLVVAKGTGAIAADPQAGFRARYSHRGEQSTGPGLVSRGRDRSPYPARALRRRGRGPGASESTQREENRNGGNEIRPAPVPPPLTAFVERIPAIWPFPHQGHL